MEIVLIVWNIILTVFMFILAGAVQSLLKASIQIIEAIEAHDIEKVMEEGTEKNKIRYLCIVRNIRNKQSKTWNARIMNWELLVDYFSLGSTRAQEWCEWLGIEPDSHSV